MNAKNAKGTGTPKRKGARNSERTVKKDPEPGGWDAPILEWDATIPEWDATIPEWDPLDGNVWGDEEER